MSKYRILMISTSLRAGLTYHYAKLAVELKNRGHEVIVASGRGEIEPGLIDMLRQQKIRHYVCKDIDIVKPRDIVTTIADLRKIIKKEGVDIIHANGIKQVFVSYLASISVGRSIRPAVLAGVTYIQYNAPPWKLFLITKLFNWCPDYLLILSEFTKKMLIAHGLRVDKAAVVHAVMDLDNFDYAQHNAVPCEYLCKKAPDEKMVVYVGNMIPLKGHVYYVKAAAEVLRDFPAVKFFIVGWGALREELEKLASDLGIGGKLIFTGRLPYEKVATVLAQADVCVIASLTETYCRGVIEAMAAGKPVVSTPVGVAPEVIRDGETGYLVPTRDSVAMARAILRLLQDPEGARQMGQRNRELVEDNFRSEIIIPQIEELYRLAIGKKHKSELFN